MTVTDKVLSGRYVDGRKSQRFGFESVLLLPAMAVTFIAPTAEGRWAVTLASAGLWALAVIIRRHAGSTSVIPFRYVLLAFWVMTQLVLSAPHSLLDGLIWVCSVLAALLPIFVFDAYRSQGLASPAPKLLLIAFGFIHMYLWVANVIYLNMYPMAARYLTAYQPDSAEWQSAEFALPIAIGGGFPYVYGLVPLIPVLGYLAFASGLRNRFRVGAGIAVLALLYVIYLASFTIALLVGAIAVVTGMAIAIMRREPREPALAAAAAIAFVGTAAVIVRRWRDLLDWIASFISPDSVLYQRMFELAQLGEGASSEGSVSLRMTAAMKSIESFLEEPLLGNLTTSGFTFTNEMLFVGQHNEWFDSLARYGLIGSIALLGFVWSSCVSLVRDSAYDRVVAWLPILAFIALGAFNPILGSGALWSVFVLVPALNSFIEHHGRDKELSARRSSAGLSEVGTRNLHVHSLGKAERSTRDRRAG